MKKEKEKHPKKRRKEKTLGVLPVCPIPPLTLRLAQKTDLNND
jgi:hypothetical protein